MSKTENWFKSEALAKRWQARDCIDARLRSEAVFRGAADLGLAVCANLSARAAFLDPVGP